MDLDSVTLDDLCLHVAIVPPAVAVPDEQAAIDQVLQLVAQYHAEIGAGLDRISTMPSLSALRRSPLGRELRFLASVGRGEDDAAPEEVRAGVDRVLALLLRSAAATDFDVPTWFWRADLGRLLAAAVARTYSSADLVHPASAAERLDVDRATIDHLVECGTLEVVRDEVGQSLIPLRAVERLRAVALELEPVRGSAGDDEDEDDLYANVQEVYRDIQRDRDAV